MADVSGFLKIKRKEAGNRPLNERICDHSEVEQVLNSEDRMLQASRCMDCGIPFCHWSCPVDNLIPEWNDLLYKGDWKAAYLRLAATNNFPEFTGRICPASCEHACVLNINQEPVTIRENEVAIVEKAFSEGYIKPQPPKTRTGKKVAVIGSGPAGLAASDLLNKSGHLVTLFEKDDKAGGLLRYGIPDFKLSKATIDRRLDLMVKEGLIINTGINIGKDISCKELLEEFDAICIAIGATHPRDLVAEGRDLKGIHFAMEFLPLQNRVNAGQIVASANPINADGKKVLVIGGGDTGSDCVGTSIRQKAESVTQIEIIAVFIRLFISSEQVDNFLPRSSLIFFVFHQHSQCIAKVKKYGLYVIIHLIGLVLLETNINQPNELCSAICFSRNSIEDGDIEQVKD